MPHLLEKRTKSNFFCAATAYQGGFFSCKMRPDELPNRKIRHAKLEISNELKKAKAPRSSDAFAFADTDQTVKNDGQEKEKMIAVENNELSAWASMISNTWGGSHAAIARAMEVPIESISSILGYEPVTSRATNGREDLIKALAFDNDELTMFWSLYSEAWRNNNSPATFAHTFSHLLYMLRQNSTVTFDACIELRDLMDKGYAHIKSCARCSRIMIEIPSLAQPIVCDC